MRTTPPQSSIGPLCSVLVAFHLAAALAAAAMFQVHRVTLANCVFAMLIASQACLVGLWGGLAWRWRRRRVVFCIIGVMLGSAWLWGLTLTATQAWHRAGERWDAAKLCSTAVLTTAACCAALRWRWRELARYPNILPPRQPRPFQFSLRQLMLVLLAISVALAIGRALGLVSAGAADERMMLTVYSMFMWLFSTILLAAVLAPAKLGPKSLSSPFVVSALVYSLGLISHRHHAFIFALFAAGSACIVSATLLVLRVAGYRLAPTSRSTTLSAASRRQSSGRPLDDCDELLAEWLEMQRRTHRQLSVGP